MLILALGASSAGQPNRFVTGSSAGVLRFRHPGVRGVVVLGR